MSRQRGFAGRSREDLYAEAESVSEMLATLKGMGGHRGRQRARPPYQDRRSLDLSPQEEWTERPWNPARGSWRGRHRGRPGPPRHPAGGPRVNYRQTSYCDVNPKIVQQLMTALTNSRNYSLSLLNLLEHYELPSQVVRMTVASHGHLFTLQEEVVSLTPRLKLCATHSSSGCQSREACDGLHICPNYVLAQCNDGNDCVLGHRWHTDHNLAILKRLSMEYVRYHVLRDLLRRDSGWEQGGEKHKAGPLEVCQAYNDAQCDQLECPDLHVCLSFVVGLTRCTLDDCRLNHNLLSPACCHLLKLHHLPVNEAPRDVAMAILQANPSLKDKAGSSPSATPHLAKGAAQRRARKGGKDKGATDLSQKPSSKKQSPADKESEEDSSSPTETESDNDDSNGKGKKTRGLKESRTSKARVGRRARRNPEKMASKSSETETDSEGDDDDRSDKGKARNNTGKVLSQKQQEDDASQGRKAQVPPKPTPRRTLWAHYYVGDVADPQICYYSVETMCRDEESGCSKLHSITHFHWQVKEQSGRWINLRPDQVKCIERAFCDPAIVDVKLPRLDPSKLDASISGLFLLLGRDVWQADFSTSSLINSTKSRRFQLRRLCTESVSGQSIKASTYHWYFLDINQEWVKYGNVDTAGNQHLVSSITSADIESHYLKTPQQPLIFNNSKFTFVLDLITMKQTNQSTKMSREVRRRPEPHLPDEKKAEADSGLPPHWDPMQPEERSRLVTLGHASEEYKKVVALLGTRVPVANIVKLDRIQNPFQWIALQNKIKEMTALYKNAAMVNVRHLFHGTTHDAVPRICNENFEWRLHGTATGQSRGRGTYFGTDAGISYGYCRPDSNGLKYMFVARVAIGSVTTGNSNMALPPINPATLMPYESTADNSTNPSMIIKYCKQEYYPEYLLTLK